MEIETEDYWKSSYWKLMAQEDLPFLPTPMEAVEKIFLYLKQFYHLQAGQRLIDLGAGDGRIILHAAEFYQIFAKGIEINESFVEQVAGDIRAHHLESICFIEEGDLYAQNLADYDIIFTFLIPSSHRIFKHVIQTARKGAVVVSVRWPLDSFQNLWSYMEMIETVDHFPIFFYVKK